MLLLSLLSSFMIDGSATAAPADTVTTTAAPQVFDCANGSKKAVVTINVDPFPNFKLEAVFNIPSVKTSTVNGQGKLAQSYDYGTGEAADLFQVEQGDDVVKLTVVSLDKEETRIEFSAYVPAVNSNVIAMSCKRR